MTDLRLSDSDCAHCAGPLFISYKFALRPLRPPRPSRPTESPKPLALTPVLLVALAIRCGFDEWSLSYYGCQHTLKRSLLGLLTELISE